MTFTISQKSYAILAEQIIEVVQLPELNIVEKLPEYLVGLMNLRSKIISVVDLRKLLGLPISNYSVDSQIIIVNSQKKTFGIIVDSVDNAIQFNKECLEPLPYNSDEELISGIYNSEEKLTAFLDLEKIIQKIETPLLEDKNFIKSSNDYISLFPDDKESIAKFKKRALNLQKELKVEISQDNYNQDKFVSFCLNKEIFCISLKYVKEFCKLKLFNLTSIPCVPEFIAGIVNLRGEFITVIDIKSFLQIKKTSITEKTKIIVVEANNLKIGLIVDDVFDMINIPHEKLKSEAASANFDKDKFVSAEVILEKGGVMSVLNLEKFLEDERIFFEDAV